MIRIAAVADLHFGADLAGTMRPHLEALPERADVLLVGGDLTRGGEPEEAMALAEELRDSPIPIVAVLGNHDYHSDREGEVRKHLEEAGVVVLEGEGVILEVAGTRIGVAGAKGFGGGFVGASGSDFGEPEMKAFIRRTKEVAARVEGALSAIDAPTRVALLHYSPTEQTAVRRAAGDLRVPRKLPARRGRRPGGGCPDPARPRP